MIDAAPPSSAPPPSTGAADRWLTKAIAVLVVFAAAALYPLLRDGAVALLAVVWIGLFALRRSAARRRLAEFEASIERRRGVQNGLLAISAVLVLVGGLELTAQLATRLGGLEMDTPMRTMLPEGAHDWRLAHITADRYREPDPVLFWRPVDRDPYTAQRFRGPVVEPGDSETFRIFCYGDSNTDGPTRGGGWPEQLQRVLDERPGDDRLFEVVNAGVAGYSSHQGLLRLEQEIERFRPDLVLVSFGWNDAAGALGQADRDYRPPPPAAVGVQRLLLKYRFYRVAKHYLSTGEPTPVAVGPRVSLGHYRENLQAFRDTAHAAGSRIVFLTRPHQHTPAELAASSVDFLRSIPDYNEALRAFSASSGAALIDVQSDFQAAGASYFADEAHFTLDGHRRMAERLAVELARLGALEP